MSLNIKILSEAADQARGLCMDAVEASKSGHLGLPLGCAEMGAVLYGYALKYNPDKPRWINRDIFVLSAGHGSMFLYAWLHMSGYDLPMSEIKRFRQLDSKTPGHPESHITSGVETTTGPLGQGAGNSVGMAIASKWLAANFNKPGFEIFDFRTYAVCGDGDLMEGVASEAASLAGHLRLSNLCWIYDNNHVTLDGPASWSFSEDVMTRFVGYGWNVTRVADANDLMMLARGYENLRPCLPAGE